MNSLILILFGSILFVFAYPNWISAPGFFNWWGLLVVSSFALAYLTLALWILSIK